MPGINLSLLLQQQFGYIAKPFDTIKVDEWEARKWSLLGTPIMWPMTLRYRTRSGGLIEIDLPNEPIVSITGGKTVVKTEINSTYEADDKKKKFSGTYKEVQSLNDYQITIEGICLQEEEGSEDYPEDQVRAIRDLIERPQNLEVVHPFLSLFNINKLIIESCSFPAAVGSPSMQPYQLICSSDKDIILEI